MIQEYIGRVTEGGDLSQAEARETATFVFEEATEAQIGALLTGLRAKGETEAEIAGLAEGMRGAARTIAPDRTPLVDTCGTGGDDYDTINVSTTSAIVVSGAGVPVAKHGNYSVSSSSGSADVLEVAGVNVEAEPPAVERAIERDGMRTVFNVLGPLTNPAGAGAQVVGVYDPDLVPVLARALARMDVDHALVVHGSGMDEIALHGETAVAEVEGETISEYTLTPADLGLDAAPVEAIAGGTPEENAADLRGIVSGDVTGAKRDVVLANAGAAIYAAGGADSLEAGVEAARAAIASGAASEKLEQLRAGA
jgi:anthranilate phosphoribosyltransferase